MEYPNQVKDFTCIRGHGNTVVGVLGVLCIGIVEFDRRVLSTRN